jgi:hypothetical protein
MSARFWRLARLNDAFRVNDEPSWCWTHEVERIAGDERQRSGRRRVQCPEFIRLDDHLPCRPVSKGPARRRESNVVAVLQASKRAEEGVAVPGERSVSFLPRQRRIRQMPALPSGRQTRRPRKPSRRCVCSA